MGEGIGLLRLGFGIWERRRGRDGIVGVALAQSQFTSRGHSRSFASAVARADYDGCLFFTTTFALYGRASTYLKTTSDSARCCGV